MVQRFRSFASDQEIDQILDDLEFGQKSKFIKEAIKRYAMDYGRLPSLEEVKEIEDQELHPQTAPPLEEQVGHPLNERSAEGLEESPEDLDSLKESGSSLKQSEPTDTSDSLTPLLTLLSHRLTESLKEE